MRILITGGFGFIGGRISQYLQKMGHDVTVVTRSNTNLHDNNYNINIVKANLLEICEMENICKGKDLVIHTAGLNAKDCKSNPTEAIKINGLATSILLEAAKKQGVKKMIYFSTAHVYRSPLIGDISENTYPRNLHPYATSHRIGEDVVLAANLDKDFHGIVIRLSNGFGVPILTSINCWGLLVNDLCRQAIEFKSLNLNSTGLDVRNFITLNKICQVINAIICKFDSKISNNTPKGLYNLGSAKTISVMEMTKIIQSRCKYILGYQPKINSPLFNDSNNFGTLNFNSQKIVKLLGFFDDNFEMEIDDLLIYCKKNFN